MNAAQIIGTMNGQQVIGLDIAQACVIQSTWTGLAVQVLLEYAKSALLHCTTAGFTPPRFDHKSFLVHCPVALLESASYPILVHRLTVYAPRFLPTLGHPHAVAFALRSS